MSEKNKSLPESHNTSETKAEIVKENVNSLSGFFSLSYVIILIVSISYNVGYFKYINPQIVNLMTLSDYINETIHNVWLFFIPVILFYSGSLAYLKKKLGDNFFKLIFIGISVLVVSLLTFLKGSSKERIWPLLKSFFGEIYITPFITIVTIVLPLTLAFVIYKFSYALIREKISKFTISLFPIILFIILVYIPYIGGSFQGKIETKKVDIRDYKCQSVSIMTNEKELIEHIYILKDIEKGLIVRNFNSDDSKEKSNFFFIHWNEIYRIIYHMTECI